MSSGKGDVPAQRRRRRDRYRGCRVCGVRGAPCVECDLGAQIVAAHGAADLSLVVDGSFMPAGAAARNAPRVHRDRYLKLREQIACEHPTWPLDRVEASLVEALTGASPHDDLGHGGAGLVLVRSCDAQVLATCSCGFRAEDSWDAEFQAVIRGARWAPSVVIYTDVRDMPRKLAIVNRQLDVRYLDPNRRIPTRDAYALAHQLSVEGRCREAPETIPAGGLAFASGRAARTTAERRQAGVDLLLEQARREPCFDGDFTALAERLGWTHGNHWQANPVIKAATARWSAQHKKES